MRTALILLLVASVASVASWKRWHYFVSRDPLMPPAYPTPTRADRNHGRPVPAAVSRILDRPLPAFTRLDGRFRDAVDTLRGTGLNVFVDWRSLERVGVARDTPVSVDAGGLTVSEALTRLLAAASTKGRPRLGALDFHIDDKVVTVSTREALAGNTLTRVYDVRDLVRTAPAPGGGAKGAAPRVPPPPPRTDPARLARLIGKIQVVEPDTWRDKGGQVGAVRELQGQLIVTQTPWNQRLIVYTLERERWWLRWREFLVRAAPTVLLPVALVAALLATPWLRRRRARLAGRCETCGYDLRATPARCPECGATPGRVGTPVNTDPPSPGTPGESRAEGVTPVAAEETLTPALSRNIGRGSSAPDAPGPEAEAGLTPT